MFCGIYNKLHLFWGFCETKFLKYSYFRSTTIPCSAQNKRRKNFNSYVIVFVENTAKVYDEDDYNDDYCVYFTFNYEINSIMLCIFSHL